jgi:hypothetical protein
MDTTIEIGMPIRHNPLYDGSHVQVWADGKMIATCNHNTAIQLEQAHSKLKDYFYKYYQISMMLVKFNRGEVVPMRG